MRAKVRSGVKVLRCKLQACLQYASYTFQMITLSTGLFAVSRTTGLVLRQSFKSDFFKPSLRSSLSKSNLLVSQGFSFLSLSISFKIPDNIFDLVIALINEMKLSFIHVFLSFFYQYGVKSTLIPFHFS